ncbi:secondary thiamine-phosphate synthase enzyme YjbQ [Desulfonatronospira sp.]|uniref:secondary thiamine-phosphate synthase enzyme YjbQ n=2 Tax=Desulfonatronospira sp. TaxID=1962951 RepID=UPI0025C6DA0B|nr:secondary thiamine-phosphate synthase enzyme YjbQ [Desulfonatronospira sp.]
MHSIGVKTNKREQFLDITREVQEYLSSSKMNNGVLTLYSSHTTAGLTINEGADPSVMRDILVNLERLVPRHGDYQHMEGNSDAHIKTSLMGPSLQIIVDNGRLMLGTWQKIFFTEFDGPRSRKVWLKWIAG